jgi:thioredoxin 1
MEYLNKDNFDEKISSGVVIVSFTASWCGPCRLLTPVMESMQSKYSVPSYKVDVEQERELAKRFAINNVPFVIAFKDGVKQDTFVGFKGAAAVEAFYKSLV